MLDTDITSKNFVCLRDVLKTYSRYVFKTCLQDVFSVTISRLPRRLEDVFKTSCERSWKCLQDVFVRRLQDVLEDVKLLRWKRVLKTNKCLLGYFLPNMYSIANSKLLFGYNLNQNDIWWGTFLGDIELKHLFELWTPYIENISYSVRINYINITAYRLLLLMARHKICINCRWIFSDFFLKQTWVWVFRKSGEILQNHKNCIKMKAFLKLDRKPRIYAYSWPRLVHAKDTFLE